MNRENAACCLRLYGWTDEEIDAWTDEEIAERILWLACGDFREFRTYVARGYAPENVPAGSEVFYLGM